MLKLLLHAYKSQEITLGGNQWGESIENAEIENRNLEPKNKI